MKNPNEEFETALSEFTGAKGVIAVDSCAHAIELGLRYSTPKMYATIPEQCHYSVPLALKLLGIEYMISEDEWENEHRINGSIVYNAGDRVAKDMFQTENPVQKKIVCVSFGPGSSLEIGHGGAILTNDKAAYVWLQRAAGDGRDLEVPDWEDQKKFVAGYGFRMRTDDAAIGMRKLQGGEVTDIGSYTYKNYPNIRDMEFIVNETK